MLLDTIQSEPQFVQDKVLEATDHVHNYVYLCKQSINSSLGDYRFHVLNPDKLHPHLILRKDNDRVYEDDGNTPAEGLRYTALWVVPLARDFVGNPNLVTALFRLFSMTTSEPT